MAVYNVVGVGQRKKFFDDNSYKDVVHYATNPLKAIYVGGLNLVSIQSAAEEMEQVAIAFGKNSRKRLRHSVLSFTPQENVSPEQANFFAFEICKYYSPEYQILYAVHKNTDNLHIHFIMNQVSFIDGHRYRGQKKDYYDFQKHMKKITRLPILLSKDYNEND